jgi:hypothetical protein
VWRWPMGFDSWHGQHLVGTSEYRGLLPRDMKQTTKLHTLSRRMRELYFHFPIRLHGLLSTGTITHFASNEKPPLHSLVRESVNYIKAATVKTFRGRDAV